MHKRTSESDREKQIDHSTSDNMFIMLKSFESRDTWNFQAVLLKWITSLYYRMSSKFVEIHSNLAFYDFFKCAIGKHFNVLFRNIKFLLITIHMLASWQKYNLQTSPITDSVAQNKICRNKSTICVHIKQKLLYYPAAWRLAAGALMSFQHQLFLKLQNFTKR